MRSVHRVAPRRARWILAAPLALAALAARADESATPAAPRLRWLVDVGAEAHAARPLPSATGEIVWASVPGATLAFSVQEGGALEKIRRVASDFASGQSLATAASGAVVADREGRIALYERAAGGPGDALRWRRDVGEPVLSVAWDGGERVWIATRDERLLALSARDGSTLFAASLGARAATPALPLPAGALIATKSAALLRVDTGKRVPRWRVPLPASVLHAPVLANDGQRTLALCGSLSGELSAFDVDSGRMLWSVDLGGRLAGAPLATRESVIAPLDDGSARAYTLGGKRLWDAPGVLEGPASLFLASSAEPRAIVLSRRLAVLDAVDGARSDVYPQGALEELRARFHQAMLEGEGAASAAEQRAAQEREAFALAGPLFGAPALQPGGLVFGTEEGWIYRFDPSALRPTFRYRAGADAAHLHAPAGGHLLVSAGEELFALRPEDGALVWRRSVGGPVQRTSGNATLAVLAGERRTELDASDGARRASRAADGSWPGAAAPDASGRDGQAWLVASDGSLALAELEGDAADALAVEGRALLRRSNGDASFWIAAARDGRIARVEPAAEASQASRASVRVVWEQRLPEPVVDVHAARDWILLRLASGKLAVLASESGQLRRRLALARSEREQASESASALLIHGERSLRVLALPEGELRFELPLETPALAAELTSSELVWLDRAGVAHVADARSGAPLGAHPLGTNLKEARAVPDGFGVLSDSGEVGFVELHSPGDARETSEGED